MYHFSTDSHIFIAEPTFVFIIAHAMPCSQIMILKFTIIIVPADIVYPTRPCYNGLNPFQGGLLHLKASGKLSKFFSVQDMTVGRPMDTLIAFSIPLLVGNFAQQLYNTVDSIIVGQYIGDTALAAVGTSGPILNLMLVLFMGISTGASILSAQFFGAKDRPTLSRLVGSTFFLTLASGILMSIIGYFSTGFLITLVHPPENVSIGAVTYLQIIFIGMTGAAAYNILSGVLRGMGDSFYPLVFLVIACLSNIVLDLVFVKYFGWGIAGVAWATIIAQGISGILCTIRLLSMKNEIDINRSVFIPDRILISKLVKLGFPAGITSAIFSMSAIVVQNLTNSMGELTIAATVAVMRVDGFAMMPNFTFGTAATTYVGQNIGAGKPDRVRPGTNDLMRIALICSSVLVACILLFGRPLIGLFTQTDTVISLGARGLRWQALGYIAFAVSQVLQGVMRGAGETVIPMWISVISTIILRMPLAYLIARLTVSAAWPNGNPDAIFSSLLISWVLAMVMTLFTYKNSHWKRKLPESIRNNI